MKKIGFIDYYIDEWHANNYPDWIRKSSFKEKYDVAFAWEEKPAEGKRDIDKWCKDFGVEKANSIKELVEKSDAIIVLSPGWPEYHEKLSDLALTSGKPVYIDKPIADKYRSAVNIISKAEKYHTPVMSSSALRFGLELQRLVNGELKSEKAVFAAARGGGSIRGFVNYGIHQIEILVMTMGFGAARVMQCGNIKANIDVMAIAYNDGRTGLLNRIPGQGFEVVICKKDGKEHAVKNFGDMFPNMIEAILGFFDTGKSPVPVEETLEAAAVFDAGIRALAAPGAWVDVPELK